MRRTGRIWSGFKHSGKLPFCYLVCTFFFFLTRVLPQQLFISHWVDCEHQCFSPPIIQFLFSWLWQLNWFYCIVQNNSKYDLYSKSSVHIDVEKVKPYYESLIKKVCTCANFCVVVILNTFFFFTKIGFFFFLSFCSTYPKSSDGNPWGWKAYCTKGKDPALGCLPYF